MRDRSLMDASGSDGAGACKPSCQGARRTPKLKGLLGMTSKGRMVTLSNRQRDNACPGVSSVFPALHSWSHDGLLLMLLMECYDGNLQGSRFCKAVGGQNPHFSQWGAAPPLCRWCLQTLRTHKGEGSRNPARGASLGLWCWNPCCPLS